MVQKYKRKTDRPERNEDNMRQAIENVHNGLACRKAVIFFEVPLVRLRPRCEEKDKLSMDQLKRLGSKTSVFTEEQE